MALSDQEQRDLFKLVLDMHKLWFEMGFIQNKIDPKNPTKGADVLSDMALWVNRTLGLAAQGAEVDPQRVAEALKPVIGPVVAASVRAALGADNVAQADAIVNEITKRLGGVK